MNDYEAFVRGKLAKTPPTGFEPEIPIQPSLFKFQRALVHWALRRGRAAIFAERGLGKSRMQVEWAHHVNVKTNRPVLILAPLSVAKQTTAEGASIDVSVKLCREARDITDGINVTNYDRLHKFDPDMFGAIVLDESSIIKSFDSKTLRTLLSSFRETPFKLCCTATPAPNDWTEMGCHAEFLGICTRSEMLSEFFCHDGGETQTWRLKGHARGEFWAWVASWAALLGHPRDLGPEFDQEGYDLPPLQIHEHLLPCDPGTAANAGLLFVEEASSLMDRRRARKASIDARVQSCAQLVNQGDRWVVWSELNAESQALTKAIDGSLEITGSMDADEKERRMDAFMAGEHRVLVSKPSLAGFGVNLQFCRKTAFVGVTDSWESYHQALGRFHRFGQTSTVDAHVFASEAEGAVVANLQRKEAAAKVMAEELARETASAVRESVLGQARYTNEYIPSVEMQAPEWLVSGD